MIGVVLMHGWGLGPATWQGWRDAFGQRPVVVLDAGYSGPAALAVPHNPAGWIGIGHSLGFARLAGLNSPWRALVGLGAFLHFCPAPGLPDGAPPEMLGAMLERLATNPEDVLARFHRRCGIRDAEAFPPLAAQGLERLRTDLAGLLTLNLSSTPACPTLLLHAQDDRIAPVALAREAARRIPGAQLRELASGGHALPMTRSGDCVALVQEFLHGLP